MGKKSRRKEKPTHQHAGHLRVRNVDLRARVRLLLGGDRIYRHPVQGLVVAKATGDPSRGGSRTTAHIFHRPGRGSSGLGNRSPLVNVFALFFLLPP